MVISLDDKMVYRKVDSKVIKAMLGKNHGSAKEGVSIGDNCSVQESAIGAITLFNAKNAQI